MPSVVGEALAAIATLRSRLDAPPGETRVDGPLEPENRAEAGAEAIGEVASSAGPPSEDELMDELAGVDEGNEEALIAVARRLKRARHGHGPA